MSWTDAGTLKRSKEYWNIPDNVIAELSGKSEEEILQMRKDNGIVAAYKMVDTCAAEFEAETPYYYSCYRWQQNEVEVRP